MESEEARSTSTSTGKDALPALPLALKWLSLSPSTSHLRTEMPHKRPKKSVRDAITAEIGFNNAPTAADSVEASSSSSKRRSKGGKGSGARAGPEEFGGLSKNLYRILNAESIRKERRERLQREASGAADPDSKKRKRGAEQPPPDSDKVATTARENNAKAAQLQAQGTSSSSSSKEAKQELKIRPGESLKSYNMCVEPCPCPKSRFRAMPGGTAEHISRILQHGAVFPHVLTNVCFGSSVPLPSRVEQTLRPSVASAISNSRSLRKKAKLSRSAQAKQDAADEEAKLYVPPPRAGSGKDKRATEFAGVEKVALRDVAMEPPSLAFGKKRTGSASGSVAKTKADRALELGADRSKVRAKELPVSLKQQQEMQAERERAVNMWVSDGPASH